MSRSIRITADTAALKKSISDISKMINKDLGKSKIELFSPDTKKFLRSEAVAYADQLKKKMDGIKTSTEAHRNALNGVVKGSKEELAIKTKILKASQQIVKAEQEHQEVVAATANLQQNAFQKQFMKMSGLSTVLKGIKGIAGEGGGLLGGLGGMLGLGMTSALAYGGSRVMAGRETWKGGVEDRLKLMGRGEHNLEPQNPGAMTAAGLDAQSMRSQRLQAMDVFGRSGATEKSVVQRAGFERAYGVDQGTMTGIGAGLRPAMGGQQANMTVMKLQAALLASGIKDAIGPYLETAASMLTELNEKGFSQDDAILGLFNQMVKSGMGEGKAKSLAMGVDQSIRGSTGEQNAFFQSVFHKAGIGGNTIGGMQGAMQMGGLFGADLDKYKGHITPGAEKLNESLGVGKSDYAQKVARSLLDTLKQSTGGMKGNDASMAKYRIMQNMGLGKDMGQAELTEGLLEKLANPATSGKEKNSIKKQLADIQDENKDPNLAELKRINTSTAGIYDVLQKVNKSQLDQLGEVTGGVFNDMDKLLVSIDGAILSIAKTLTGYETPAERQAQLNQDQATDAKNASSTKDKVLNGDPIMMGDRENLKNLSFEDQVKAYKEVKAQADIESQKGFIRNKTYQGILDSGSLDAGKAGAEAEQRRKARTGETGVASGDKKVLEVLNKISDFTGSTSKNTKTMGGLPASSSSTSGTSQ